MNMYNPATPGEVIRKACFGPLGQTVATAAKALGIRGNLLSNVMSGRNRISAELVIRLEKSFGGSADVWLRIQLQHN